MPFILLSGIESGSFLPRGFFYSFTGQLHRSHAVGCSIDGPAYLH